MKYLKLREKYFKRHFETKRFKNRLMLNLNNSTNPIFIKCPFILNEDVARLAGMMPDGSLIKKIDRIFFSQKKDIKKVKLFGKLLKRLFLPKSIILYKIHSKCKSREVYINSYTLAHFFYYILKIPKSDEQMRVPFWVFRSPRSVKVAYLREAFAMEGTISKALHEIRFISKDKKFALDIRKLLLNVSITSFFKVKWSGTDSKIKMYRVSVYSKENFKKFKEIGFSYKFHRDRFNKLIKKYKL